MSSLLASALEHLVDAGQRRVLFLDVMRQRGEQYRDGAGIVLGARVPIVLTSGAASLRARLACCTGAALYADARRRRATTVVA